MENHFKLGSCQELESLAIENSQRLNIHSIHVGPIQLGGNYILFGGLTIPFKPNFTNFECFSFKLFLHLDMLGVSFKDAELLVTPFDIFSTPSF